MFLFINYRFVRSEVIRAKTPSLYTNNFTSLKDTKKCLLCYEQRKQYVLRSASNVIDRFPRVACSRRPPSSCFSRYS